MVGDRERIAIALIAELELALIVGAPQLIRSEARRQRCSFCAGSRALQARDQPVPIQDRMNSAAGWHLHFRRQAPQQGSRILRAPQLGFSRLAATMAASICSGS